MKHIAKLLKRIFSGSPPHTLTAWQRSQIELRQLFANDIVRPVTSWTDSLTQLSAVAA